MGSLKLQIIPFKAYHWREVKPDANEIELELAEYAEEFGVGYTACILGVKIGCAGIAIQSAGRGELWACFTPSLKHLPVTLFKECRRLLEKNLRERKDLKVIYALVDPQDKAACRFVEHLHRGFKLTRVMYAMAVNPSLD